jgi:hypothetical protein
VYIGRTNEAAFTALVRVFASVTGLVLWAENLAADHSLI